MSYESLFQSMKDNGHLDSYELVMLAYDIKATMDASNYHKVEATERDRFSNLKNNLPVLVRNLIWNGKYCTVKTPIITNIYMPRNMGLSMETDAECLLGQSARKSTTGTGSLKLKIELIPLE